LFRSALIGIPIDRRCIASVDVPIATFFPELSDLFTGGTADVTLYHLLSVSSGVEWPETTVPYPDPDSLEPPRGLA